MPTAFISVRLSEAGGFLIRFVMKRIARKAGAATDTSRDHE